MNHGESKAETEAIDIPTTRAKDIGHVGVAEEIEQPDKQDENSAPESNTPLPEDWFDGMPHPD